MAEEEEGEETWTRTHSEQEKSRGMKNQSVRVLRVLLVDNYDSYTFNVYQMLSDLQLDDPRGPEVGGGDTTTTFEVKVDVIYNNSTRWTDLRPKVKDVYDAIVLSPGPGTPACESDIGICKDILESCVDVPVLGICLGHQALAYAHGARIVKALPFHGRLSKVVLAPPPPAAALNSQQREKYALLENIPNQIQGDFQVVRYHSLVVDQNDLPECILPLAWSEPADDEDSRLIMALAHKEYPHYGLQFHPESICTCYGNDLLRNFLRIALVYQLKNACRPFPLKGEIDQGSSTATTTPMSKRASGCDMVLHKDAPDRMVINACVLESEGCIDTEKLFLNCCCERGSQNFECDNTFWLDSSSLSHHGVRFSFMGKKGGGLWRRLEYCLGENSEPHLLGRMKIHDSGGGVENIAFTREKAVTFWDAFDQMVRNTMGRIPDKDACFVDLSESTCEIPVGFSASASNEKLKELPFDFQCGYVGYIGYEMKEQCGGSRKHVSNLPNSSFFFADQVIAVDHEGNKIYLVELSEEKMRAPSTWMRKVLANMCGRIDLGDFSKKAEAVLGSRNLMEGLKWSRSHQEYIADIEACKSYLLDGESYEICLTNRLKSGRGGSNPLAYYHLLRKRNPAPYSAFLNFGSSAPGVDTFAICCSSPERFLKLDGSGTLEAKPIKGTIRRGTSTEEDRDLYNTLCQSNKDRAENLMIVDLLRNDLGRVSEIGSVHVPKLMDIESYARVHQMVSTVRGKKASDMSSIDCIRCAFPAGSMTGAPKIRTMEIIDKLEGEARGIYSGTIGYISSQSGAFDLNVVIRTAVLSSKEVIIGAGGAITIQSDAESEFEEIEVKSDSVKVY